MITTEKCWNQHHLLITYSGSEQMWLGHLMGTEPAKPPLCAYHCNRTGHSAFGSYPNVLAIVDKRVSVFEEASPMHRATVAERVTAPEKVYPYVLATVAERVTAPKVVYPHVLAIVDKRESVHEEATPMCTQHDKRVSASEETTLMCLRKIR